MSSVDQRKTMSGVKKHRMSINFNFRRTEKVEHVSPPGYSTNNQISGESVQRVDNNLLVKRSWDIALGPLRQVPMNLFIMYMAGTQISIFPIMMVGMLFVRPTKAILSMSSTFKAIEGDQHYFQKFVYLLGNLACLLLALYKCQSMGLLPTHPSDWLDFLEPMERAEYSGGGLMF